MSQLRDTGERVVPEWVAEDDVLARVFLEQHLRRYETVAATVRGRRVLDVGCGVGYGAAMMAAAGAEVVAVDVSADALSFARSKYPHPNVTYVCAAVADLQVSPVDVITCFEVLEHLPNTQQFFDLVTRTLTPDGVCHLSASVYPTMSLYRYHLRDFTADELRWCVREAGLEVVSELHQSRLISAPDVRRSATRHRASFPVRRFFRRPLAAGRAIWKAQVSYGILHENLMLSCVVPIDRRSPVVPRSDGSVEQ